MKILYSVSQKKTYPYPRADNSPIEGLDSGLIILDKVETPLPEYDPLTQEAIESWDVIGDQYVRNWEIRDLPPVEPSPDWDGFNAAMLANVEFNQFTGIVLQSAPVVALGIPAALAQVSSNGVNAFGLVYGAFCQIGGVQQAQKDYWASLAESFNLPVDFVSIVMGSIP